MTKQNKLSELSNEELNKRKNLLKGVLIGFGIIYLLAIAVMIYLLSVKGFKNVPIATLIPIFSLPVIITPILTNLGLVTKELKSRTSGKF